MEANIYHVNMEGMISSNSSDIDINLSVVKSPCSIRQLLHKGLNSNNRTMNINIQLTNYGMPKITEIIEHEIPMPRTRVQYVGLQMTINSHFKHDRSKIIFLNHLCRNKIMSRVVFLDKKRE
mgnify:CR=1 FL=1